MHGVPRIFVSYSPDKGSNNPQVSCKADLNFSRMWKMKKGQVLHELLINVVRSQANKQVSKQLGTSSNQW